MHSFEAEHLRQKRNWNSIPAFQSLSVFQLQASYRFVFYSDHLSSWIYLHLAGVYSPTSGCVNQFEVKARNSWGSMDQNHVAATIGANHQVRQSIPVEVSDIRHSPASEQQAAGLKGIGNCQVAILE